MLLEIAIGDAYGAGFEATPNHWVTEHNHLSAYVKYPRHTLPPRSYTDDTQMSIAVAEAIICGERWTPSLSARHFISTFKRDPREGYARGFFQFLLQVEDEQDFLRRIRRIRPNSDKSGAAMRACPIGVFPNIGTVIERARLQAQITHHTPGGMDSAVVAALMTHYGLYEVGPKSELAEFINSLVPGPWAAQWSGRVGPRGLESVHAAMTAVISNNRLSAILKTCVSFGGDTDTVAAIALGAASGYHEIKQDLPQFLFDQLENGTYGRDYLRQLDRALLGRNN